MGLCYHQDHKSFQMCRKILVMDNCPTQIIVKKLPKILAKLKLKLSHKLFGKTPPKMFGHGQQSSSIALSQSSTFSTPSFSKIEKEATADDFMSLMGSSPASSGYHSQSTPVQREDNLLKPGLPSKALI